MENYFYQHQHFSCLYFWDSAFKFIGSLLFGSQLVAPTVTQS